MQEIPNYTKWLKPNLVDACGIHGLSSSGTKADLTNRLYAHAIKKRMASYRNRKDRYISRGIQGANMLEEIQQLKDAMMKAAEEQNAADRELLEKRTVEVVRTLKKKKQSASAFAEEEVASIKRQLRAAQDQPMLRTPPGSRVKKVQRRSAILRRDMSLSRPLTPASGISTPSAGSHQSAYTPRPLTRTHCTLTPSTNSRLSSHPLQQSTQSTAITKPASKNIAKRPLGTFQNNSLGIRMSAPVHQRIMRR